MNYEYEYQITKNERLVNNKKQVLFPLVWAYIIFEFGLLFLGSGNVWASSN